MTGNNVTKPTWLPALWVWAVGDDVVVTGLAGRERERGWLAAVVRDGGALLLRGEPGAGKTALLEEALAGWAGRVLPPAGAEGAADIPDAAVAGLLRPFPAALREHAAAGGLP